MISPWRVGLTQDENLNDSDKIFTVPVGTDWQLLSIWVEYTSSATAGDRQLEIQLQDSGSVVTAQWQTGKTQAASLSYNYLFATSVPDLLQLRDTNYLMTPLIGFAMLTAGEKVRIWDNNAVDAAADDMIIQLKYGYRTL